MCPQVANEKLWTECLHLRVGALPADRTTLGLCMDLVVFLPWSGLLLLLGPQILSRYHEQHPWHMHYLLFARVMKTYCQIHFWLTVGLYRTCSLGQGCKILIGWYLIMTLVGLSLFHHLQPLCCHHILPEDLRKDYGSNDLASLWPQCSSCSSFSCDLSYFETPGPSNYRPWRALCSSHWPLGQGPWIFLWSSPGDAHLVVKCCHLYEGFRLPISSPSPSENSVVHSNLNCLYLSYMVQWAVKWFAHLLQKNKYSLYKCKYVQMVYVQQFGGHWECGWPVESSSSSSNISLKAAVSLWVGWSCSPEQFRAELRNMKWRTWWIQKPH